MVFFYWSLSDSKSPQVSRNLLSILADLNNAVVWIVSTRPLISKSPSPLVDCTVSTNYNWYHHQFHIINIIMIFSNKSNCSKKLELYFYNFLIIRQVLVIKFANGHIYKLFLLILGISCGCLQGQRQKRSVGRYWWISGSSDSTATWRMGSNYPYRTSCRCTLSGNI